MKLMTYRLITLLLLAFVLAACAPGSTASPSTPSVTPQPSQASASPSAAPTISAAPIPVVVFERATVPAPEMGSAVTAVAPGGDGLVAVGFDGRFGNTLWTSADSRTWRDVTPSEFASFGIASIIATSDGRLIGVGRANTIDVDAETAAAFVSEDGLTWRVAREAADLSGQMIDVVETDDGFFAVGGVPGADSAGVWHSPDGESWARIGEDVPAAFFWSIAERGPGLVIAGWRRNPEPDAAVWTSADAGQSWMLATDPELGELAEGTDVLATDAGSLIMVGGSFTGEGARIWTSADSANWPLADVDGDLANATVRNVVATPIGHLAVGAIGTDAAAWLSTDGGATWAPFGDPVPDAYFHNAFVSDGDLLLLGVTQTGTVETGIDSRAMIWTATLSR